VFSDIVIVGPMDGLALADAVTRRWPHVPVLLTTAYSRAAEQAARRYPILRKPYGIEELGAALERLTAPDRDDAAAG
jgi:DNA-binding LytR/AlgR family response regulator